MDKISVLLADDHTIFRQGLRMLLAQEEDIEVVGEAANGNEALELAKSLKPDIILLDIAMPEMDGLKVAQKLKKTLPETKIIALTVHKTEEYLLTTLQAGTDGYVLKDATHKELVMAINNVMEGKPYLSPGVSEKVIEGYLEGKESSQAVSSWETLSQREREVLKLIAEGYKNKEIAEELCISFKTVEKHRANLMKKLDLHNAAALAVYAVEKGLVNR